MSKIMLKIVGDHQMSCGGCEGNVRRALSMLPGVTEVAADRNTQLVEVSLSSDQIGFEQLKEQLDTIGYEAELT
jgi:copper chaperone CopZ